LQQIEGSEDPGDMAAARSNCRKPRSLKSSIHWEYHNVDAFVAKYGQEPLLNERIAIVIAQDISHHYYALFFIKA
jgi:hypothetical protein